MNRIGAIFSPYPNPPEALPAAARLAEDAGVRTLWLWEDCFRSSAFAAVEAALAATERLRVGIGIAPVPMRNTAATAMEIATIERLHPGRFVPGLGHGVQSWMQQIGARVASPLTLLREQLPAVRALLAGDTVSVQGCYVTLRDVALDWPPAAPPRVYAAAEGPRTLRLVGEVADGVVLDSGHTPDEDAAAIELVRAGWADAARAGAPDVVAYVVAAFGPDALARATARVGDKPDVHRRVLAGTPGEVAAGARAFFDAGVDEVVLLPPDDEDLAEFFARAGEVTRLVEAGAR